MLERFLSLHPRKIDLSLGRTFDLLAKLGHPEQKLPPVIHVAGTNGKGSTVALMRAMLEAEERHERELDRAYWLPLKAELERLRHER